MTDYTLTKSDDSTTYSVLDTSLNSETLLDFIGYDYFRYGDVLQQNELHLSTNFYSLCAGKSAAEINAIKAKMIPGQVLYDGLYLWLKKNSSLVKLDLHGLNTLPTGDITIAGPHNVDHEDTVNLTALIDDDGLPSTFTYQWKINGVAVSGATTNKYTPVFSDAGKKLTIDVTYTDNGGTTESVTSPEVTITAVNVLPTGSIIIQGSTVGNQLTKSIINLADTDGLPNIATYNYQWKLDGSTVVSTTDTYTPVFADMGKSLTVTLSYTDLRGTNELLVSSPVTITVPPFNASLSTNATQTFANIGLDFKPFDVSGGSGQYTYTAQSSSNIQAGTFTMGTDGTLHYVANGSLPAANLRLNPPTTASSLILTVSDTNIPANTFSTTYTFEEFLLLKPGDPPLNPTGSGVDQFKFIVASLSTSSSPISVAFDMYGAADPMAISVGGTMVVHTGSGSTVAHVTNSNGSPLLVPFASLSVDAEVVIDIGDSPNSAWEIHVSYAAGTLYMKPKRATTPV